MKTLDKITLLARGHKSKKKSKGSGRSAMLRVIMPMLSGDKGDKLASAINSGDPDAAKNFITNMADDVYQAVEMIRDKKVKQ